MDANLSMEQIRMDVKNVTALNQEGYDMDVISHKLDLSKDYVQTILTCAQGFIIPILTKNVTGMSGNIFSAFFKMQVLYHIVISYYKKFSFSTSIIDTCNHY